MPVISRIRVTNLTYENGAKRFNDEVFQFDGHNGILLLENGGGKSVLVQAVIQAVLPHAALAERRVRDTFSLENNCAHIAVEWILNERPRRYGLTAVTLFLGKEGVGSHKYVYEYMAGDPHSLEKLPLVRNSSDGGTRPAGKEEIYEYYRQMESSQMNAHYFSDIKSYQKYIEENFKIIASEWKNVARINGAEGGVEAFFDGCKTTAQLVDNLLIPTVEEVLAGDGTRDFAAIFEKQQEHFKEHRHLQEQIREGKQVSEEIDRYAEMFSRFHQAQQQFYRLKQEIKAVYGLAAQEREAAAADLDANARARKLLDQEQWELDRRAASYELALLGQELELARRNFEAAKGEQEQLQGEYDSRQQRLENLQIAGLKADIRECEEKIAYYKQQLQDLDTDESIRDLQQKLRRNASQLRFHFLQEENRLEEERRQYEKQEREYTADLDRLNADLQKQARRYTNLLMKKSSLDTRVETAERDMKEIAARLLDNPLTANMETEKARWELRAQQLDSERYEIGRHKKRLEREQEDLQQLLPRVREELQDLHARENRLRHEMEAIETDHSHCLTRIKEWKRDFNHIDSLYLKQTTVLERLESGVETVRSQREGLLLKERQALRWFDLYQQNTYFTADPKMEKRLHSWQSQFKHLEAGTVYAQRAAANLHKTEEELYRFFPFWAVSIICLAEEAEKLMKKLAEQAEDLSHPVAVLTEEEARSLVNGALPAHFNIAGLDKQVFPAGWRVNLAADSFFAWKQRIAEEAKGAREQRQRKESEMEWLHDLLKEVRSFFERYPYETYQQLQLEHKELRVRIFDREGDLQRTEARLDEVRKEYGQHQDTLSQLEQEQLYLSGAIQQAQEYMRKKAEREQALQERYQLEELIKEQALAKETLSRQAAQAEEQRKRAEADSRSRAQTLQLLQVQALYQEVREAQPVPTSFTRGRLETEYRELASQLQNNQKGRRELEEVIGAAERDSKRYKKDLDQQRRKSDYALDEDLVFPAAGKEEIDHLIGVTADLKVRLKRINADARQAENVYNKQQNTYEMREKDFYGRFPHVVIFSEPLPAVQARIQQEREELQHRRQLLEEQEKQFTDELYDIGQAMGELERKHERFGFLADRIEAIPLPPEAARDFPYRRQRMVAAYVKGLEEIRALVESKEAEVMDGRQRFEVFCQEKVENIKLREMMLAGIRHHTTFDGVVEFKTRMDDRISKSIRMAQEDIRELDRELQQFINQLHTYLVTLARELRGIPKKTRVKAAGGWKEVFVFDVPEWDEKEGKDELRRHVDWMIGQLEHERYRDEMGNAKPMFMRQDIERWLQSQQLLHNVMKGKTIKVKCRKVTSDGQISSYPIDWGSSVRWSVGEKWSKNMALFLGVLNYMAEKRQHLIPGAQRYRTVILDNPFGQASSNHVLEPVFFIAEQLGFQLIALTALAEGKFVRDYFPTVYSCRLRPSTSEGKQIVTSEQEIRHAYFMDHDPEALQRLGKQEQTALF